MATITWQSDADVLAEAKARKLAEINAAYEAELAPYQSSYPETEKATWPYQRAEALAWVAWDGAGRVGDEPATPTLDAIAAGRQMDRETLITKAHEKAVLFAALANAATGKRQRLEDEIEAATTVEAIANIGW